MSTSCRQPSDNGKYLLEPGIALHHGAMGLGDDVGVGEEGGVIHHQEHHPVHVLLPYHFLDALVLDALEELEKVRIYLDILTFLDIN